MTAPADESWFETLYLRLEKPVFNVVYRWVWNADEARDVTQEAFLRVWNSRARIDRQAADPLVFRAAVNLASNRLRARKLWQLFTLDSAKDEADASPSADTSLDRKRKDAQVRRAIEALPPKLKEVVVLCELSGLSYQQVADTLQIPVGTVGSRRNLALTALEKSLGPLEAA
jgi:RNA polymerase sigma-70 factor (ECF subfamily)